MSLVDLLDGHLLFEFHPCQGLTKSDHCLKLPHSDGYGVLGLGQSLVLLGLLAVVDVDALQFITGGLRKPRIDLNLRVLDVFLQQFEGYLCILVLSVDLALMQVEDMRSYALVIVRRIDVSYHEDAVEPGKNGGLKLDLF